MCCVCETAKRFADRGMERWRRFTATDVAAFKICLLSIGTLAGAYFVKPVKRLRPLLWFLAVASYGYIVWRLLSDERE